MIQFDNDDNDAVDVILREKKFFQPEGLCEHDAHPLTTGWQSFFAKQHLCHLLYMLKYIPVGAYRLICRREIENFKYTLRYIKN